MQSVNLAVTTGWSHSGATQTVLPGQGNLTRPGGIFDDYLNDHACWKDVSLEVWEHHLRGYQVLNKWLSHRESKVLGLGRSVPDVSWWSEVAGRIAAILEFAEGLD